MPDNLIDDRSLNYKSPLALPMINSWRAAGVFINKNTEPCPLVVRQFVPRHSHPSGSVTIFVLSIMVHSRLAHASSQRIQVNLGSVEPFALTFI